MALCNHEYYPNPLGVNFFSECHWNDGRIYKGEWRNGMAHGQGVEINPNGQIRHDGMWYEDSPVNYGAA